MNNLLLFLQSCIRVAGSSNFVSTYKNYLCNMYILQILQDILRLNIHITFAAFIRLMMSKATNHYNLNVNAD